MKVIIATKQKPKLYESTDIACHLWQNISPLWISTSSHERTGLSGQIAEGISNAHNSPKKIVIKPDFIKQHSKDVHNAIVQYLQKCPGWQVSILEE